MENSQVLDLETSDIENNNSNKIESEAFENPIVEDTNLKPEERIYVVATDKDNLDWKGFLYQLIHDEGLDPWNVDLGILTNRYLSAVKQMTIVDFDITGKFLTIAVFLLKTKAEHLVDKDLRGIDDQIASVQITEGDGAFGDWETLEELDSHLEDLERKRRRENYEIKVRNPIARKRKVNIFDLINLLEKTFKQSNKRKANFLQRNGGEFGDDLDYDGPMYEENPMDLATIIDNLHNTILDQLQQSDRHINFSNFINSDNSTLEVLEKFMPLLYLHNQDKVYLKQKNHFDDIEIHHKDKVELPYDLNDFLGDDIDEKVSKKNKK
jgi:chromatin segregation and condensation protein Rec8/ScpA/Scc1 (kleisin family)